jgi:hypothetical protein
LSHERDQILLFLRHQLQLQDNIEELYRVFQRKTAPVMQMGRALLYAAQGECLNGAVSGFALQKWLQMKIVHQMVKIKRWGMAARTLCLAEENVFPARFSGVAFDDPGGL